MLESLVKCGAFDFLGRERAELFACVEESLASASASHRDRASGQASLFDELPAPTRSRAARIVTPWPEREKMSYEKELLGFYVTGHPLDDYAGVFAEGKYQTILSLGELADRATFRIAGAIVQVDKKFTKREGKPFAVVWLEDMTGTLEVVIWNEVYVKVSAALVVGRVIAIRGTLDKRDDSVRATALNVKLLEPDQPGSEPPNESGDTGITLRFSPSVTPEELRHVREVLARHPGDQRVQLVFERANSAPLRVDVSDELRTNLTPELETMLAPWLETPPRSMADATAVAVG
jgi:DNA polymerase-3 subunit alpha